MRKVLSMDLLSVIVVINWADRQHWKLAITCRLSSMTAANVINTGPKLGEGSNTVLFVMRSAP